MGAIFGFTGPPDAELVSLMASWLANRGNSVPPQVHSSEQATLVYLEPRSRPSTEVRGILQRNGEAMAVAGQLYAPANPEGLWQALDSGDLAQLRGSFVLARSSGEGLTLIRDGAGRRTIYWGRCGDRFVFAIEPKAIHRLPQFSPRMRPAALAQFLTFSFVPGEGTMLEDLYELPAGHSVKLEPGQPPKLERWFQPERVDPPEGRTDEDWVKGFRDRVGDVVEEMRPQGQDAAIFLSGGIDSSVITAEVAARHDRPVHTYAIHFGEDYPNELEFAQAVAARCGTCHEEVLITPRDFTQRLPEIIWNLDEPIGDPVSMPNFELSRLVASRGYDRVFNGEGGDPCFGGPKNLPMLLGHWYGGVDFSPGHRERAYLASYRRAYEELEYLLAPDVRVAIQRERDLEGLLTPYFEADCPESFLNKLLLINMRLKGAHLILPKVERMLGANGLIPLSPLFDERLVEMALQLPGHLKLHGGVEKVILKRAYRGSLPDSVIDRPKSGMRVPVHYWFKGEMKRFARRLLSPKAIRAAGVFDEGRVKELLRYDNENGASRFGLRIWMLVTFEIWRRLVIERQSPEDIEV